MSPLRDRIKTLIIGALLIFALLPCSVYAANQEAGTLPVLSNGGVTPDLGYVTTDFTYSVTYTDADNDAPISITVTIDGGTPQDMTEMNPADTDYADGKDYKYTTSGLAKGVTYTFRFAASDGVVSATGDTGIHTGPTVQNSPPVADAGPDKMALIGTPVMLDGSGSSDADDDDLDYSWTQTDGPAVILSDPTAVNPTFTPTVADTYTFNLVVNDGTVDSSADTAVSTIKASNIAPVLSDGTVSPTSGYASTAFTYSVVYADDDNDVPMSITITIDSGTPQDMTEVDPGDTDYADGKDYEYTVAGTYLGLGSHTFQFAASDGIDDATGDIDSHDGPTVRSSGGGGGGGGGGGDTRPPVISNIECSDCTKTSIIIKWITDERSTSQAETWASEHTFSPLDENLVLSHEVELTNLKPCCLYYFCVISKDSAGNKAASEENNFTTMGTPATFTVSALSISPAEVKVGETITVSVLVTNTGDSAGTYGATLKLENVVVAIESVTLAGGASEEVTFITSKDVAGTYSVSVDGQSGTVVVKAPVAFTISSLSISPAEVKVGESVTISALVTNTGDNTSTYEVILKINNVVVTTKSVTLAGGASEGVTFTTSKIVAGTYTVDLNGLPGTFVVKAGLNWWLIGGIIAAIVAVLLLLYFYVWRKRGASRLT